MTSEDPTTPCASATSTSWSGSTPTRAASSASRTNSRSGSRRRRSSWCDDGCPVHPHRRTRARRGETGPPVPRRGAAGGLHRLWQRLARRAQRRHLRARRRRRRAARRLHRRDQVVPRAHRGHGPRLVPPGADPQPAQAQSHHRAGAQDAAEARELPGRPALGRRARLPLRDDRRRRAGPASRTESTPGRRSSRRFRTRRSSSA